MYVGRLLCVPSLLLASCLYLLKDLPWPCTASCYCCSCSGGSGGGGSQGKGRARREHLRMTAGVQLHGVTQSARAPALPCSAKPEVSAEQRALRGAPVCVCRGERNLSIAGRRKGGHHYGLISKITSKIFWSSSKCCMCNSEYATWNFGWKCQKDMKMFILSVYLKVEISPYHITYFSIVGVILCNSSKGGWLNRVTLYNMCTNQIFRPSAAPVLTFCLMQAFCFIRHNPTQQQPFNLKMMLPLS